MLTYHGYHWQVPKPTGSYPLQNVSVIAVLSNEAININLFFFFANVQKLSDSLQFYILYVRRTSSECFWSHSQIRAVDSDVFVKLVKVDKEWWNTGSIVDSLSEFYCSFKDLLMHLILKRDFMSRWVLQLKWLWDLMPLSCSAYSISHQLKQRLLVMWLGQWNNLITFFNLMIKGKWRTGFFFFSP